MGWIKDSKIDALSREAQDAWDAGLNHFTPILQMEYKSATAASVPSWQESLDAIIAIGWELHTWEVVVHQRPLAMPLFVRS
ncbi:hypothetical protein [Agromyces sp. GXQ0307]|uniref:hypothetical protein n=1 Tax=Agromyces sp. GXQ0307 TaxID=3377835 RepID=UPI00383B1048